MKPVYLLSGFLGSGKTSTLIHLISQFKQQGLRPAIFMNEIGNIPFDSSLLDEEDPLKEVLNGCICCTGSELVEAQLQSLFVDHSFDVLLIETTGAAHPISALDTIMSPLFADKLEFKGIITVIDSHLFLHRESLSPQARMLFIEQIRHASVILANKIDRISEQQLSQLSIEVQQINNHAPIIFTKQGKVPVGQLEQLEKRKKKQEHLGNEAEIGSHFHLNTKHFTFDEEVSMEEVEQWVRQLPDSVYRIKGYVPVKGKTNVMQFQYAFGMINWQREDMKMPTTIVVIGENLQHISFPFVVDRFQTLLSGYRKLFPGRELSSNLTSDNELKEMIQVELLDELTHPRLRVSPTEKFQLAEKRIASSSLSELEKKQLLSIYLEVLNTVNTN